MIDHNKAKEIAMSYVDSLVNSETGLLVLVDSDTIEKSYGRVFFYQSKKYLDSGDWRDSLVGNAPFIVLRTGELIQLSTNKPIEQSLKEFEATQPFC